MRAHPEIVAAVFECEFKHAEVAREIGACEEFFVYTPPYQRHIDEAVSGKIPFRSESLENYQAVDTMVDRETRTKSLRGVSTFYLRNSSNNDVTKDSRFPVTKQLEHESWFWRPEIRERIPYTIECIESLPYRTLGLIRVFVCDDTFMPTHRDTNADENPGYDRTKAVGISLIPSTGGVGMLIWNKTKKCVHEVKGNCLLFDDSNWHGVPMTKGRRITMRIFGDLDYEKLGERFVESYYA